MLHKLQTKIVKHIYLKLKVKKLTSTRSLPKNNKATTPITRALGAPIQNKEAYTPFILYLLLFSVKFKKTRIPWIYIQISTHLNKKICKTIKKIKIVIEYLNLKNEVVRLNYPSASTTTLEKELGPSWSIREKLMFVVVDIEYQEVESVQTFGVFNN